MSDVLSTSTMAAPLAVPAAFSAVQMYRSRSSMRVRVMRSTFPSTCKHGDVYKVTMVIHSNHHNASKTHGLKLLFSVPETPDFQRQFIKL